MAEMRYEVKTAVKRNGELFAEGDTMLLSPEDAARLVELGAIVPESVPLDQLSKTQLVDLAEYLKLDASGNKGELLKRLKEADVELPDGVRAEP